MNYSPEEIVELLNQVHLVKLDAYNKNRKEVGSAKLFHSIFPMISEQDVGKDSNKIKTNEGLIITGKKNEIRISFKYDGKDVTLLSLKQEDYKKEEIKEKWIECLDTNLAEIKEAVKKYYNKLLEEEEELRSKAIKMLMENFDKSKLRRTIS